MANEVRITVGADTKDADRAVKGFRQRLEGISRGAKIAGLGLSAMGAGGVIAIKGFISAALEQEKAISTLSAVMANAGESFGEMEGQIMATTAALQQKTNFGDEAQIRALAKLVPTLGSTELALKALPAAMDIASLTGKDLSSVVETMGPALAGVTNRIRGTSIEFTDAQGPAERIAMLLADVGGAAEADADPLIQMSNAMGDLKEKIGIGLLPVIQPLVGFIQMLSERVQALNPMIFKIGGIALAAATGLALIGGPLLLLIGFLPALITGFGALSVAMGPITLIVAGIAAVIAAGIVVWKNWDAIIRFASDTLKLVKDKISGVTDRLSFLTDGIKKLWGLLGKSAPVQALGSALTKVKDAASEAKDKVREFVFPTHDAVDATADLKKAWKGMPPIIDDATTAAQGLGAAINTVVTDMPRLMTFAEKFKKALGIAVSEAEEPLGLEAFKDMLAHAEALAADAMLQATTHPLKAGRDLARELSEQYREQARLLGLHVQTLEDELDLQRKIRKEIEEQQRLQREQFWLGRDDEAYQKIVNLPARLAAALKAGTMSLEEVKAILAAMRRPAPTKTDDEDARSGGESSFAHGGVVPGPKGRPLRAIVHGGEVVTPVGQQAGPMTIQVFLDGAQIGSGIGRIAKQEEQVRSS